MSEYLCPRCRTAVDFTVHADAWECPGCASRYPLVEGAIPDFVSDRGAPSNFVGEAFRERADEYDRRYRVESAHGRWVLEELLAREPRIAPETRRVVVEIGAGTGPLTRALASRREIPFERLYVTDLSPEMLRINWGRREKDEPSDRVRYLVCNGLDLPLPSGSADLVVGLDILHHVLDYRSGLREIARVLAPGGVCVLKEPHAGAYRLFSWLGDVFLRADPAVPFRGLTLRDRRRIRAWQAHVDGLLAAAERNDLDALSRVDDKYFFDPAALAKEAAAYGFSSFSECNVLHREGRATPYGPMVLETYRGVGVGPRGLAFLEEVCGDFDRRVGAQMLERFPVNTLLLFWR